MKTFFLTFFLLFTACGSSSDETTDTTEDSEDNTLTSTLTSIQENIFTPSCATGGCHSAASASESLSLAAGQSHDALVGRASEQVSSMNRVTAGDIANSYLIHKLENTQESVGGSGVRMPKGAAALSATQIQAIKDWIEAGALNN